MGTERFGAGVTRSRGRGTTRFGKYQLRVTGQDATDVIAAAGGWLVDRAMAGWDVTVILSAASDPSPLRILGVAATTKDPRPDDTGNDVDAPLRSRAIAVSSAALRADDALRRDVADALRIGVAEVTVWGDAPHRVLPGLIAVEHVLSSAARAFKERALRAAGSEDAVSGVESFCGRASALRLDYSDLTASAVATSFAQR